jgi:hypothetical protein
MQGGMPYNRYPPPGMPRTLEIEEKEKKKFD